MKSNMKQLNENPAVGRIATGLANKLKNIFNVGSKYGTPAKVPPKPPQQAPRLPGPASRADDVSDVGTPTASGGQVFRDRERTIHQAGRGREAEQQAAQARAEAERAQRAADQQAARRTSTASTKPSAGATEPGASSSRTGGIRRPGPLGAAAGAYMVYDILQQMGMTDKAEEYLRSIRDKEDRAAEIKRSGEESAERVLRGEKVDLGGARPQPQPQPTKDDDKVQDSRPYQEPDRPSIDLSPRPEYPIATPQATDLATGKPDSFRTEPRLSVPVDLAEPEPQPQQDVMRVRPPVPVTFDEPTPEPEPRRIKPPPVPPVMIGTLPPEPPDEPPRRPPIPPIMPPPPPPPPPPPEDTKPEPSPEPEKPGPLKTEPTISEPPKVEPPKDDKPEPPKPEPTKVEPVKPQAAKADDDDGPFWRSPGGADKDETGLGYLGSETSRLDVSPAGRIQTGFKKDGTPRYPELYNTPESVQTEEPALTEWLKLAGLNQVIQSQNLKENIMKPYSTEDISRLSTLLKEYETKEDVTNEADMEEGNLFTGNLAKARAAGKKEADLDGDGNMEPVKEDQLSECGMMEPPTNEMPMQEPEQKKRFDITATMNSEGEKNITVHAEGDAAEELAQILKLSGMASHTMSVSEAYANEPKVKVMSTDTIMKQGNDLNRPKKSYSSKPGKHDNPMADKLAESWQQFKKVHTK